MINNELLQQQNSEEQEELYEHFRFVIDKGQGSIRIDKYLTQRIENISRSKIQAAADAGSILVNDHPVKPSYKIKPDEIISVVLAFPPRETEIIPENIPVSILYEDEGIIVVDKPAGMVVHPAHGNFSGTLVNALSWHLKDHSGYESGEIRPRLAHRIDKDTSGILVVAKTEFALSKLAKEFFDHTISRRYQALVWGEFQDDEGTITGNVGRSLRDRKVMDVFPEGDQGKHAVTHYKVIERFRYTTLVECILETGRTHQIRVHMKYAGHPLFGDAAYGGDRILKGTVFSKYKQFVDNCLAGLPRQALHAAFLGFKKPSDGTKIEFSSPLPEDMEKAIVRWREYSKQKM
ncbi:MAG: RluA family pseudouridine synthase [Bacteroidota bacterium]